MADNVTLPGTGSAIATDDVAGIQVQRVKSTWGPDGTANDTDTATGKPLPVQLRSATGLIPFGEPTDAKATATDTTSVSAISLWKQISASVQALVTSAITVGTAGSPSTQVLSVQGVASGTPQLMTPYAESANLVSGAITTAMTGTTTTSLLAAPGASLRNYITAIIVSNAHATVGTDVVIQDGSGGATLMTIPAAAVYGGAALTLPTPLRQPTANTAIYCANVTTGASTKVSAVGYKAA
jgi:hypothetical protein